jgi:hypothetical protein
VESQRLLHELSVHKIELKLQNEERRLVILLILKAVFQISRNPRSSIFLPLSEDEILGIKKDILTL